MTDFSTDPTSDESRLPPTTRLGRAFLRVSDLQASTDFYQEVLGLDLLEEDEGSALLGAGGRGLVGLIAAPGATSALREPGLYHLAILLPDRAELGAFLQHTAQLRARLQGASDHGVSEAIYLSDPDGNGIEVYRDRPREEWDMQDGRVEMITAPMDARGVLEAGAGKSGPFRAPAGTIMGHVHLQVSDLARAGRRFRDLVGLDITQAGYPGALFLSAGGYHHHVGLNTWAAAGKPARERDALGLAWFEIEVEEDDARAALEARLAAASEVQESGADAFPSRIYVDEDGIGVAVVG